MTKLFCDMVAHPHLTEDSSKLNSLHSSYRQLAQLGLFYIKDHILYLKEVFKNDTKFVSLHIVPSSLRNMIFIEFRANPIVGHLNAHQMFHRIRQQFVWPAMYQYCKKMTGSCPGCFLLNIPSCHCVDIIYSFLIDTPMRVLFVKIYVVRIEFNADDTKYYLIAACRMTLFTICEPPSEQNTAAFALALMKVWLRFGFFHTIIVDKDSKFLGIFANTAAFLKINIHVLLGERHDPMIVKRINRYLNSCLAIFCNKYSSFCVTFEVILMSLYA